MESNEKIINNDKIYIEENSGDYLDVGILNINQEVDIKENPNKYIVNTKKQNLIKQQNNLPLRASKKLKKRKIITYEDIYLGNDMFISAPKSYPRDYEKNNKYILSFTKTNLDKCASNRNLINIKENKYNKDDLNNTSIRSEEEDEDDDEEDPGVIRSYTFEYSKVHESTHLKSFLTTLNNHRKYSYEQLLKKEDVKYIDEDEIINKNIFYIQNEKELNNLNYYNKKNKCNISYISLNLFIKKLCTENLKGKYPILYKSFLDQYHEIFPISSLIEKIVNAFDFYINQMNIEIPDLILFLNKIISLQFKKIQDNESLTNKLIEVYKKIEDLPWINDSIQKEIENINFILTNTNQDFDVEYTKYLISDRKRTKAINIRKRTKAKNLNNKTLYKYPYFYIFDFTDEEIAKNLTLISYKMMSSIDVNELWSCNFSKEDKLAKAPNVMRLIERFDKLVLFIIEDICSYETNKAKAKAITKWANIAKRCKELHNYNDLLIINESLNNSLLKKSILAWKKVNKTTLMLITELNKFCTNQQCYINIRREMASCKHIAYIPYLGILLKEIVNIEEKYKYLEKFGNYNCINCIKLQKIYWEVQKFFSFKNHSFTFTQINDLNILNQLNPKTELEIEEMIINNEKNKSTLKELLQTGNKKKRTKSDELFYC